MKNLMIKFSTMLAMVAVLTIVFGVTSCKKDDPAPTPVVEGLNGFG